MHHFMHPHTSRKAALLCACLAPASLLHLEAASPSLATKPPTAPAHPSAQAHALPHSSARSLKEQSPQRDALTAEEYLQTITRALAQKNWQSAAQAIEGFSRDFGERPETSPVVTQLQPALGFCLYKLERFDDALAALERALKTASPSTPATVLMDVQFQKGLCLYKLHRFAETADSIGVFLKSEPSTERAQDSRLLAAKCLLMEGSASEAARQLESCRPLLDPKHAQEAVVLELTARIEAEDADAALGLLQSQAERLLSPAYTANVNALLLRLGANLNAQSRFRAAITCLRKIREFSVLVEAQQARIRALEKHIASLGPASSPDEKRHLTQTVDQLQIELETLRDRLPEDASARLHMAAAYQGLERPREAALILEDALQRLPQHPALERAGITLAQLWLQLEAWPKVRATYDIFTQRYPSSKLAGEILFIKGLAEQKDGAIADALRSFESLRKMVPGSPLAIQSEFMSAFTLLVGGEPEQAAPKLRQFCKANARHPLAEEAGAWLCVSYALAKKHAQCLAETEHFLESHQRGANLETVLFQQARSTLALRNYGEAAKLLARFTSLFPESQRSAEAYLLLHDAHRAADNPTEALKAVIAVTGAGGALFDDAWFKAAKLLQELGHSESLAEHLEHFAAHRPQSPRFAEAMLLTQKSLQCTPAEQDRMLWDVLRRYGSDPENLSVEPLLETLLKRHSKDATLGQLAARLAEELAVAESSQQEIWSVRLLWALTKALQPSSSEDFQRHLKTLTARAKPDSTSDRILASIADFSDLNGQPTAAAIQWRDVLKWHPATPLKDRALAFLIAHTVPHFSPQTLESHTLIHRFETECAESPLLGKVLLTKSRIASEAGQFAEAKATLEALLAKSGVAAESKAEALFQIGEIHMRNNQPRLAIPYYQRVYVMYGRWKDTVAKAYLRSGEAFEQIGDSKAARNTYQEILSAGLPLQPTDMKQLQTRLSSLGINE